MVEIKLVLVGDGGVGKTTLVKRFRTGEFEKRYVATLGVEVHPVEFRVKRGDGSLEDVTFNIWDCAGQEQHLGLGDGYYIQGEAVIYMGDLSVGGFDCDAATKKRNDKLINNVRRTLGDVDIPWVAVYNKCDKKNNPSSPTMCDNPSDDPNWITSRGIRISAKSNYHFDLAFLAIVRKLFNDPKCEFVVQDVQIPPEVEIDAETLAEYERMIGDVPTAIDTPAPTDMTIHQ